MAANPEQSEAIGVEELRSLEASVLKALCLTINTAGSELKYKILDSLTDDDFYFPINRALFQTLAELHRRGEYVISANLDEELQKVSEGIPAGFVIDELFSGTLPGLSELSGWVVRMKERSRTGMIPTVKPPSAADGEIEKAQATQVRAVSDVKKKIAEEHRRQSSPELKPLSEKSAPKATPPPAVVETPKPAATKASKPAPAAKARQKSSPAVDAPRRSVKAVLSSEADDWTSYMDDLASKQGKTFDTGFQRLDEGLGGLSPGLMLLVDEDRDRLVNFMKQITDQFASGGSMRCLYVSSELPKAALRVRTLARLASVSVSDIEKGRLKKDSDEWQRIDSEGQKAAKWLKRVFVFEMDGELELSLARDLVKKLLDAGDDGSVVLVIDSLEKVASKGSGSSQVVSQLKGLADSLDVLILAATTDPTLLASRDADLAAVFRESTGGGGVELEVLQAGTESSTIVSFRYEPAHCRFTEV